LIDLVNSKFPIKELHTVSRTSHPENSRSPLLSERRVGLVETKVKSTLAMD